MPRYSHPFNNRIDDLNKLRTRLFVCNTEENPGFSLQGEYDDPYMVLDMMREAGFLGLVIHTGHHRPSSERLSSLSDSCQKGIVCCAGTLAILGDNLPLHEAMPVFKDNAFEFSLTDINDWFFSLSSRSMFEYNDSKPITADDFSIDTWRLTCVEDKLGLNFNVDIDSNDSNVVEERVRSAIRDDQHLLDLLEDAEIYTLNRLHQNWSRLPIKSAFAIYKALLKNKQSRPVVSDFKHASIQEMAEVATGIASVLPPWASHIPKKPIRLYNSLSKSGISSLWALSHMSPDDLISIENFGRKTLYDLLCYLQAYELSWSDFCDQLPGSVLRSEIDKKEIKGSNKPKSVPLLSYRFNPSQKMDIPTLIEAIEQALDAAENSGLITDRATFIIRKRLAGATLSAIGEEVGVTRERIRQITVATFRKIQAMIQARQREVLPLLRVGSFLSWAMSSDAPTDEIATALKRVMAGSDSLLAQSSQLSIIGRMFIPFNIRLMTASVDGVDIYLPVSGDISSKEADFIRGEILNEVLKSADDLEAMDVLELAEREINARVRSKNMASILARSLVRQMLGKDSDNNPYPRGLFRRSRGSLLSGLMKR